MERARNIVYERVEKVDSCCDRDSLHEESDFSDDLTKLTSATMIFSHIQKESCIRDIIAQATAWLNGSAKNRLTNPFNDTGSAEDVYPNGNDRYYVIQR
ncbi:hypothetical protein CEXT_152111 [Caerostris extrusa]|uniref:Uncharacterized protein n=1 Tax=Caerostris extrusa TaxID=172846 RepID=A0AAV4P8W1_CAEEX|nr:hypothetical protein CEXT_152111 [Caerostris extrusa]